MPDTQDESVIPLPFPNMHPKSVNLSQTELFQLHDHFSSWDDRIHLSYVRAKAIGELYGASTAVGFKNRL